MKLLIAFLFLPLLTWGQLRIGNNPGWYGNHYTDEQVHALMGRAGNWSTRYFITLPQWEQYGMSTFTQRIKNVYDQGFRSNVYCFTGQFYTDYKGRDTTTYPGPPNNPGARVRTMVPKGLNLPVFRSDGSVNPANVWAKYVDDGMKEHGAYFDYFSVWNEPDINYNQGEADDPNLAHTARSWWNREPEPWELYNLVAPVSVYVKLCEVATRVIKKRKPSAKVYTGGLGYPAFGYWFFRKGGGVWVDGLDVHLYPMYYLRAWDNRVGGFVYDRHSDYALLRCIERINQWKDQLTQVSRGTMPIICTEINLPRYSTDPEYNLGDQLQANWTIKTMLKFHALGIRTWLFVAGEVATKPAGTEFEMMGLFENLTLPENVGAEVMTPQGVATAALWRLAGGSTYDPRTTAALNLANKIDGVALSLSTGKKILVLWARTHEDLSEAASWSYTLPPTFAGWKFLAYNWRGDQIPVPLNLTGSPIYLIQQ
jgi:hypothetical protein